MIFSPPTRRARPCAPVGNGYLCFKEMRVSFEVFLLWIFHLAVKKNVCR